MLRRQEGQAVVEAAILLPAMIFLILMTIQLTMLQQARLMADYAAYAAARTGIVQNGNNGKDNAGTDGPMHDAAVLAILPTYGRTDSFTALAATAARFKAEDLALTAAGLSQIRVYVLNPTAPEFKTWGGHLNGQEIDFDDIRPGATDATLLSLQVRYLYELRVPFANKLLQTIWMAARVGLLEQWRGSDWTSPHLGTSKGPDAVSASRVAAAGKTIADGTPEGIKVAALVAAAATGRFFLPVEAYYTMRMQSNPYLKWAHP
jgi:TadE-like protein